MNNQTLLKSDMVRVFVQKLSKAFSLLNKNLPIFLISFLLITLPIIINIKIISFVFTLISFGWFGARVALLRDSQKTVQARWNLVTQYLWKYFKRFFPLIPIAIIGLSIALVAGLIVLTKYYEQTTGIILNSRDNIEVYLKEIPSLLEEIGIFGFKGWLLSLSLLLIDPIRMSFVSIVVIKDLSLHKGLSKTISTLNRNRRFYFHLLFLTALYSAILKIVRFTMGIDLLLINVPLMVKLIYFAITSYVGLLLTSFVVVHFASNTIKD